MKNYVLAYYSVLLMTRTQPYPRLIACTNAHFSFLLTGAFPLRAAVLHTTCVYFNSVKRVSLIDCNIADFTVKYSGVECQFICFECSCLQSSGIFKKSQKKMIFSKKKTHCEILLQFTIDLFTHNYYFVSQLYSYKMD